MPENEMPGSIFFFAKSETTAASTAAAAVRAGEKNRAEAQIVERFCAGDTEAFNELYKTFAPLVHGVILARAPQREVQDLVQEVFLLAYKNLHTLRDKTAVGAWLAMIARNRAAEYYRSAKPTEELPEDLSGGENNRQAEAREILETIRALPESYKETLILRLVEGMTGQEIAERTGLTPESVRVNLHRGMKLLRQKLGITE
jgi:RNA polymerase sigma-70 factor, ECF subfamily